MPPFRVGLFKFLSIALAAVVALRCSFDMSGQGGARSLTFHGGVNDMDEEEERLIKEVLQVDEKVLDNVLANLDASHASVEWVDNFENADEVKKSALAFPLSATVDRRPVTVRKQMGVTENSEIDGSTLGCALSGSTFVANTKDLAYESEVSCHVCFTFSNREDRDSFVPGAEFELFNGKHDSTKCFEGSTSFEKLFPKHSKGIPGFGHPYIVDCVLPSGIKELTCREISNLSNEIKYRDDIQAISFRTHISYVTTEDDKKVVHTEWPWTAVMSHDDDRSKIADALPDTWDDAKSKFVASTPQEVQLVHAEGPICHKSRAQKNPLAPELTLPEESTTEDALPRLSVNLFNFIRNAPNSTHMIPVVNSQLARTYKSIVGMLRMKVSELYPRYGTSILSDIERMQNGDHIPVVDMGRRPVDVNDMTVMELLTIREIKILLVPVLTPSHLFQDGFCADPNFFGPYLAARYASDYNVMIYAKGDATTIETDGTLQEILYKRLFSDESTRCGGHRFSLVEHHVQPENEKYTAQCVFDLVTNKNKWEHAMNNCKLNLGNIAARTDSIRAFNLHHTKIDRENGPSGVLDCIKNDNHVFNDTEIVQVHLSEKYRKKNCACFTEPPVKRK